MIRSGCSRAIRAAAVIVAAVSRFVQAARRLDQFAALGAKHLPPSPSTAHWLAGKNGGHAEHNPMPLERLFALQSHSTPGSGTPFAISPFIPLTPEASRTG